MRWPLLIAGASFVVLACGGGNKPRPQPRPQPVETGWQLGPITDDGDSYSKNCPRNFDSSFTINPCQPHYVTRPTTPLAGKSEIRARFRIDGPADATIHGTPQKNGQPCPGPSAVTLYFSVPDQQIEWAKGVDGYRWWATFASHSPLKMGEEFEIVAPLNGRWTSVLTWTAESHPTEFAQAKAKAGRVGFTFANCEGYGHGAQATTPVTFTVLSFEVK